MKIILVRHGEAERQTPADSERQLTDFGQQQAQQTAEYVLDNYSPDVFIVSPYDRAQQTLQAFIQHQPNIPMSVHNGLKPEDDPIMALTSLANVEGDCLLVVCHMSIVAKLAALLTGGSPQSFALAEARIIECEFVAENMGEQIDKFIPIQP